MRVNQPTKQQDILSCMLRFGMTEEGAADLYRPLHT